MTLFLIIVFSLLGNVGTVVLASSMFLVRDRTTRRLVPVLVGYATGTLLGAAFLGMLPRALATLPPSSGLAAALIGLVAFYLLERFLIVRHCHQEQCERHAQTGPLILLGDAFHNFCDGVVIAAAFLNSLGFGVSMSLAVIAHEVPQELGDFAILLAHGYSRSRALVLNAISGAAAVAGALSGYFFLRHLSAALPYVLAVSASSFIYIALADLIPERRGQPGWKTWVADFALLGLGIGTIVFLRHHGD